MGNKNYSRYNLYLIISLSLFFIVESAFAIDTGKLEGRIVDTETGEPLPGANVMILETTMGSAADVNGYYLMLNIPPGKYQVRAEVIGYASMSVVDVLINGDLTTTIDFSLTSKAIEGKKLL